MERSEIEWRGVELRGALPRRFGGRRCPPTLAPAAWLDLGGKLLGGIRERIERLAGSFEVARGHARHARLHAWQVLEEIGRNPGAKDEERQIREQRVNR